MIDMQEVKRLLIDKGADNIICVEFDLKPNNIAMYIDAINEKGYIVIGAVRHRDGYSVNGISRSFNVNAVVQSAIRILPYKPKVACQMCALDGANVCVIYVEKEKEKTIISSSDIFDTILRPYSMNDVLRDVILICIKIQANNYYKDASEDQRNDYMRDLLDAKGYPVRDQTRRGISNAGKGAGEVDILIYKDEVPVTVIEALNLASLRTDYLNTHIDKIYKYDTLGNAYNFIISYVKVSDFGRFWNSYCNHVKQHKYPFPLIEVTNEINEGFDFAEIRILGTKHNRNGKETMLIHICVKIQE